MTQLLCDCPFRFLHKEILLFVLKINRHTAYLTNKKIQAVLIIFVGWCTSTCWEVNFHRRRSVWGKTNRSSVLRAHLSTTTQRKPHSGLVLFFFFFFYNILSSTLLLFHHRYRVDRCVFVLTFRINVTPSSKRIPRSGDEELQRRKQSPSRRLGRTPVICSQRIQHWF